MSRVLLLTQVLPYPPDAGPKIRQYHMLRHLAARHDVTLVSFVRPDDGAEAVAHLRGLCSKVCTVPVERSWTRNVRAGLAGVLTGRPMVVAREENAAMSALLYRIMSNVRPDVVHADQLSMASYGLQAARAGDPHPRTLLDEHNAVYLLARRMAADEGNSIKRAIMTREAKAFERYEAAACRAYDAVLTVTAEDRDHLLALYGREDRSHLVQRFSVVPICVDPEQIAVVPRRAREPGEPLTILHLGTMFWPPNVNGVLWFVREVLPLIHRQVPEARFVIVGKNPPPEVQRLAADPRIKVTGYVADPLPYLAATDAFVVPLNAGGGMRVKILDAWSWGVPVVSTRVGAEGIETVPDDNILLADDPESFAASTVCALTDPVLNRRLRCQGRMWLESHYSYEVVYKRVDRIYEAFLTQRRIW